MTTDRTARRTETRRAWRFAICNELFEGWPFERVCRFASEAGYDGVELAPFTLAERITEVDADQRRALRAAAEDAGIEIIGLHWLLARTAGLHLTAPDRPTRQQTSAYLVELARACHDLGGRIMVFGSPKQRVLLGNTSRERAFDFAVETFSAVLPTLEALDVTICMEPLSTDETDFVNTCEEAVALIDAVNHPKMSLQLDVKAMSSEGAPVCELIRRFAPRAGHFHANDPNRRGPGFGATDFAPIFDALEQAGYDRWVSVEVFDFSPDPETIALRSLDYMRKAVGLDVEARRVREESPR